MKKWFLGVLMGAGLGYLLDPDKGTRRRNITRDKALSLFRKMTRNSDKMGRLVEGNAQGVIHRVAPSNPPDNPNPDRLTLLDRVESKVLRNQKIKDADVVFDSPDEGIIEVRGVMQSQPEIEGLVAEVRSVPGVQKVVSYLHLPNTPAPNKEEALEASRS